MGQVGASATLLIAWQCIFLQGLKSELMHTAGLSSYRTKPKEHVNIVYETIPQPIRIEEEIPVPVERTVPYPKYVLVPKPYPVIKEVFNPFKVLVKEKVPVISKYPVERKIGVPIHVPIEVPVPVKVFVPLPVPQEKIVPIEIPVREPVPYPVIKEIPVPVKVPVAVPQPYPVEKEVLHPVKVLVEKPVPVLIEKPIPIPKIKNVPIPVEKEVPYPVKVAVDRPVPYPVPKPMPYKVKIPVEIPVPVEKKEAVLIEKPVPYPVEIPIERHVPVEIPVDTAELSEDEHKSATNKLLEDITKREIDDEKIDTCKEDNTTYETDSIEGEKNWDTGDEGQMEDTNEKEQNIPVQATQSSPISSEDTYKGASNKLVEGISKKKTTVEIDHEMEMGDSGQNNKTHETTNNGDDIEIDGKNEKEQVNERQ